MKEPSSISSARLLTLYQVSRKNDDLNKAYEDLNNAQTKLIRVGIGLSLSIAYNVIDEHGGEIDIESRVDKGSTFHLYLPTTAGG